MNRKLFNVFLFTVGAAIGSAVTWKVVKTKYEQIAQEEIDSVKEEFNNLMTKMKQNLQESTDSEDDDENTDDEDEDEDDEHYPDDHDDATMIQYHTIANKYRGSDDKDDTSGEGGTGKTDEVPYINGPYVISPDEFSSSPPGYSAQALDYFADGVLADSWGTMLDIEETIGEDSLECFGEYADDIVYVRNERKEIDYEVTRDPRTYYEVVQIHPNPYYGK